MTPEMTEIVLLIATGIFVFGGSGFLLWLFFSEVWESFVGYRKTGVFVFNGVALYVKRKEGE